MIYVFSYQVVDRKYAGVKGLVADVALMYSNAQAIKHEQVRKHRKGPGKSYGRQRWRGGESKIVRSAYFR